MSEARGQHEPSMEEILASIRRIIAEDGDGDTPPTPVVAEKPPSREEEVLELTEVVEDDGTVVSLAAGGAKKPEPAPRRVPAEPSVAAAPPPMRVEPVSEPRRAPPPPASPADGGGHLVSDTAAAASLAAMAQLTALAGREQIGSVIMSDPNRTLVDVVGELLRPLLKDWLDANLPGVVERLVAEEIQRLSRDQQRR